MGLGGAFAPRTQPVLPSGLFLRGGRRAQRGLGPLEKEMAAHSSVLAWRILWTEEPGGRGMLGGGGGRRVQAGEHMYT